MKLHTLLALAALALAPLGALTTPDLRIEPDQNNVTAGRLFGEWESDPLVAERLGLSVTNERVEFAPDDSFLDQIPARFAEKLDELRLYEGGVVTFRRGEKVRSSGPYLLTTRAGNPHVLMFRERDGEPLGDIESGNVFVAPGKERAQDLLLIGGDFDNEPFRAFRRVQGGE